MARDRIILIAGLLTVGSVVWWLSRRPLDDHRFAGTIEQDQAQIGFRVPGRLQTLLVGEGEAVTNHQPLAILSAPELKARRDLAAARMTELYVGARTQEIAAARSDCAALEAEAVFLKSEARRAATLAGSGHLSRGEAESAQNRAESAERRWRAALDRFALLEAGTRPEQQDQARAQYDEAEYFLAETVLFAPADGTIESLHAREGEILSAQAPVMTLIFRRAPWVRIYVPDIWLPSLGTGTVIEVSCTATPGRTWPARVVHVAQRAEFTPRNVQTEADRIRQVFGVKLQLPSDVIELRPGMTAEVRLTPREF